MHSMNKDREINLLRKRAERIRLHIINMTEAAGSGHPGGSLSAADLMAVLYFRIMRIDPANPAWPNRDRFILSKGHACPVHYAALAEAGFFPTSELMTLRKLDSRLQGHPDMTKTPGVDMTAGSLGNGLSIGLGMALGIRLAKSGARVFVMLGDGELQEGVAWEAAMAASHYKTDNLIAIVDRNGLQVDGGTEDVMGLEPLADKWKAFGWRVIEVDGHDISRLVTELDRAVNPCGKPTVIIANTVKGKGVSFMENVVSWHGKAPNSSQAEEARSQIYERLRTLEND